MMPSYENGATCAALSEQSRQTADVVICERLLDWNSRGVAQRFESETRTITSAAVSGGDERIDPQLLATKHERLKVAHIGARTLLACSAQSWPAFCVLS